MCITADRRQLSSAMVPSQMAWAWIHRGQQRPEEEGQSSPSHQLPRPRRELPRILHLGDSRSANRQLITAWRPLTPLRLCSAKCVMEMRPKQTLLPRGTLALLSRGFAPGEPGKGLRCRGEFIKSMSFPRHPIPHLPLTLGCNTIFPGPHSEEGPP